MVCPYVYCKLGRVHTLLIARSKFVFGLTGLQGAEILVYSPIGTFEMDTPHVNLERRD